MYFIKYHYRQSMNPDYVKKQGIQLSNMVTFYTPRCLVRCLLQLLNFKDEATVYDPCCGSGAMFCIAKNLYPDNTMRFYGQTLDKFSYEIWQMNLYLYCLDADLGNKPANTLLEDLHINRKFDYIISNPPFNLSDWYDDTDIDRVARWEYGFPPRKNVNYAWLQHKISHLKENGRAVVVLPNGSLTTQKSAELDIRKKFFVRVWSKPLLRFQQDFFTILRFRVVFGL